MILEKLEHIYLGALRITILIAATVALLASIGGLVSVFPTILEWSGLAQDSEPSGGTLGQFIEEQKITETSPEAQSEPESSATNTFPDIEQAAAKIKKYLGNRSEMSASYWASSLQSQAVAMDDQGLDYAKDVLRLSEQLQKSKGKPLSEAMVVRLFSWHLERFQADLEARAIAKAEANAAFWIRLGASGAAFLAFVLIVFVFLFVKIERSLRTVSSRQLSEREGMLNDA
jgi:hypothetical protein